MNILTFNCGSSSQSVKLYEIPEEGKQNLLAALKARNVDTPTDAEPLLEGRILGSAIKKNTGPLTHRQAARMILTELAEKGLEIHVVGHRFVHGGELFKHTICIDPASLEDLRQCLPLAPIHNPNSFSVIETCLETFPRARQYAVFDTAFHAGLSEAAREYAIPRDLASKFGYRKYGFHGLSCQYVSSRAAELLDKPIDKVKLIICHLGTGGSSVTAFQEGRSFETSMGYSPLAGLVMSTRCGDLDPEIILDLSRRGYDVNEISRILNHESGLIGLSGFSSNLEEVIAEAEKGSTECQLVYEVYVNRLKFYLGAYTWMLNGADAILFTDDIGVRSWRLRQQVCGGVENLGVFLDETANVAAAENLPAWVHSPESRTRILVLPTDEEQVILEEVIKHL